MEPHGQVLITGDVVTERLIDTATLDARARPPFEVRFTTRVVTDVHRVQGVPLHEVLAEATVRTDVRHKTGELNIVVLAVAEDGYQVVLSWAEVDPEFGACAALLATRYNGARLTRPTLVMPGDGRASRYVRRLHKLCLRSMTPASEEKCMRRLVTLLLAVATMLTLVSAAPAPAPTPGITVSGAVERPLTLTTADLRRFPTRIAWVRFKSGQGTQRHSYVGARLVDVLNHARPRFDPAIKNDKLTFVAVVSATDGYRAAVAWAEIDPDFAGTEVLLAYREDGRRLDRPRLVVPGDEHGGRYVSDLTDVTLVAAGR